jgi:hypothetical protein
MIPVYLIFGSPGPYRSVPAMGGAPAAAFSRHVTFPQYDSIILSLALQGPIALCLLWAVPQRLPFPGTSPFFKITQLSYLFSPGPYRSVPAMGGAPAAAFPRDGALDSCHPRVRGRPLPPAPRPPPGEHL